MNSQPIGQGPPARHMNRLAALVVAVIALSATAMLPPSPAGPLALGRPNPEGTSI